MYRMNLYSRECLTYLAFSFAFVRWIEREYHHYFKGVHRSRGMCDIFHGGSIQVSPCAKWYSCDSAYITMLHTLLRACLCIYSLGNYPYCSHSHPRVANFEEEGDKKAGSAGYSVHIRNQQRNGRKSLTIITGLADDLDLKKILKVMRKMFSTNGTIMMDDEIGEVLQLQGTYSVFLHNMWSCGARICACVCIFVRMCDR